MKLSYGQLWAVLFLYRVFTTICSDTGYSLTQIAGSVLCIALQLLIILPVISIYKHKKITVDTLGGKKIIFSLIFLFMGIITFARIINISGAEHSSENGYIYMVIFLGAVSLYCSKLGIRSAGRSAVMVLGLFVFFFAVLLLSSYSGIKISNISALNDGNGVVYYALREFADSSEILALFALPMFVETSRRKGIYIYFASRLVLTGVISLLGCAVLGKVSAVSDYPFFEICSFSNPFSVQRSDALFVMAYTLISVVNIAVDLICIDIFSGKCFKYIKLVAVLIMAAGGLIISRFSMYAAEVVLIVLFIIAGYIVIVSGNSKKGEKVVRV